MVSKYSGFVRVSLLVLFAVLSRTAESQEPAGTLILRNAQWDLVRVEVRLGRDDNCNAHATTSTHTLRRDKRWAIVSASMICWRREREPGVAERGWTEWQRLRVPPGATLEVVL